VCTHDIGVVRRPKSGRPPKHSKKDGARAHPPSPPSGGRVGENIFRSFESTFPKVGLHGDRMGVPSRVATQKLWGPRPVGEPHQKVHPRVRTLSPYLNLPHQDLFSLFPQGSPGFVFASPHMAGQMGQPRRKTSIFA